MDLEYLKKLAGITEFKGYTEYTTENMSYTASEIKKKEKEKGIKPGDKEWFELWFSNPYLTGSLNQKPGFRERKK
jgi:hypothetical protein